jgi:hypothetical protein
VSDVAGDLRSLVVELEDLPMTYAIAAARASKKIVADEGDRVAGPDGMKGKKKRGLKLRARDTIRTDPHGVNVRVQGRVPAWIWANTGTAPHSIRRRKRGPLKKMTVYHPGTTGRGAWERAAKQIEQTVPLIFDDELDKVIRGW